MSSFLQRLKSGATVVDNNAPPDQTGMVIRRLEKRVLAQPVEQLGISLGNDAEVTKVLPHTPASAANIPVGFMVCDVNGDFVENEQQFFEAARKNINLIIRLQSTTGMYELIARVLEDDERRASGAIATSALDFDELLRTTPRFNFLSSSHPLFRRYNKRLSQQRQAAALIAQRTAEAEFQRQKEIKERIKKALDEETAIQRKKEQEEAERQRMKAEQEQSRFVPEEPFLKIIKDESAFGELEREKKKPDSAGQHAIESKEKVSAISLSVEILGGSTEEPSASPSVDTVAPLSAEELLALVGVPTDPAPSPAPPLLEELADAIAPPKVEEIPSYTALPAEEYTLCSGEKVVSIIKKRTGPIPTPPPGKPPTINKNLTSSPKVTIENPVVVGKVASQAPRTRGERRSYRKRSRSPAAKPRKDSQHSRRYRRSNSPAHRHHRSARDYKHRR